MLFESRDSTGTSNLTNLRNVPESSNIPETFEPTREDPAMRGHLSDPFVRKTTQTSEFTKSYTNQRSLSHASHIEDEEYPSATKPT